MIWCKLKKWQDISGLIHTSTSWKVCSDKAGTKILQKWDKSNMLELLFWDIELPPDVTYYVFAMRHFNKATVESWSDPFPVMNQAVEYSNILYQKDTEIEVPTIFINKDDILKEGAANFPFRASKFRSNNDKHKYTSYFILDQNDDILFCKLNDEVNKEQITVPSDYKYTVARQLKFMVIHGGVSGLESKVGLKYLEMGVSHNFEILTDISNVLAKQDLTIQFAKIDAAGELGILNIELVEYALDEVIEELKLTEDNTVNIPWYLLQENTRYRLRITVQDDMVDYRYVYRILQVENYTNSIIRNKNHEHLQKLDKYTIDFHIKDNIHSEALFNKKLLLPKGNTNNCALYSTDVNGNIIEKGAKDINLGLQTTDYMFVRPINKERFLVDGIKNGKATFMIYGYNTYTDEYTLIKSIVRDNETIAIGKTAAILQISPDEFIYNPIGTNKINKLNINTGDITEINIIPLENITKAIMIRSNNNRVYIANCPTYHACMYNLSDNTFVEGYSYGPDHFTDKDTRVIPLPNGSSLVVKLAHAQGESNTLQYYNWVTSLLAPIQPGYGGLTMASTILTYSGVVILSKVTGNKTVTYRYS